MSSSAGWRITERKTSVHLNLEFRDEKVDQKSVIPSGKNETKEKVFMKFFFFFKKVRTRSIMEQ
jgi:hypothetical protein